MATSTPKLELIELQLADLPAAVKFNETLYKLDTVVQLGVISRVEISPTSDVQGSSFIVPDVGATGLFVNQARKVAYRSPTGWVFRAPRIGWLAYVADEDKYYKFTSSGEWVDSLIAAPTAEIFDDVTDGLVPAPGASSGKFLRDDASWHAISVALANLIDVDLGALTAGDFLIWGGSSWGNVPVFIPTNLDDFADVTVASVANKQVLAYESASFLWKNKTLAFSYLSDFDAVTSPNDGDVLAWNASGSKYRPVAPTGGGGSTVLSDLLLHFNGTNGQTATVDSGQHIFTVTQIGAGALSTAQQKFGTASALCSFTDGFSIADDPSLRFDGSDFSVDFWVYPTNFVTGSNQENALITKWGVGGTEWYISNNSSVGMTFYYNGTFPNFSVPFATLALNTWTHVKVERLGGLIALYLNGVRSGNYIAIDTTVIVGTASPISVGGGGVSGETFYIDEVRIVKATKNFTPPSTEYTS